jgi:hypothetical protein
MQDIDMNHFYTIFVHPLRGVSHYAHLNRIIMKIWNVLTVLTALYALFVRQPLLLEALSQSFYKCSCLVWIILIVQFYRYWFNLCTNCNQNKWFPSQSIRHKSSDVSIQVYILLFAMTFYGKLIMFSLFCINIGNHLLRTQRRYQFGGCYQRLN